MQLRLILSCRYFLKRSHACTWIFHISAHPCLQSRFSPYSACLFSGLTACLEMWLDFCLLYCCGKHFTASWWLTSLFSTLKHVQACNPFQPHTVTIRRLLKACAPKSQQTTGSKSLVTPACYICLNTRHATHANPKDTTASPAGPRATSCVLLQPATKPFICKPGCEPAAQ